MKTYRFTMSPEMRAIQLRGVRIVFGPLLSIVFMVSMTGRKYNGKRIASSFGGNEFTFGQGVNKVTVKVMDPVDKTMEVVVTCSKVRSVKATSRSQIDFVRKCVTSN